MDTNKKFIIGDWVKSYSKGVFRIEKFIPVEYEEYHFNFGQISKDKIGTLQEPLVILKRLFNSKLKKQLGADFCSSTFLKKLTNEELAAVSNKLQSDPKLLADLNKYVVPKYETRYGLHMLLKDEPKNVLSELAELIRDNGRTFTEIFEWLDANNYKNLLYKPTSPNDKTGHYLQFINDSFQVKDNKLLFTNLLAFTPDFVKMDI